MSFSPHQIERYARHLVLKEIGGAGQQALAKTKVLIIGTGGLGCPVAMYLAAAGIGTIGLVDDDSVNLSNLQRQVLFGTDDIGKAKTAVATKKLHSLNPDPVLIAHQVRLNQQNIDEIFAGYDLIIDGCDNFPTRFLVNQKCYSAKKILISGAVGRFDGQVSVHNFVDKTACYQCLVPSAPPNYETCQQVGIIGALTGIIGSVMALECIKIITDTGKSLTGRLLIWDGLDAISRNVQLNPDPQCPVCGKQEQNLTN